MGPLIGIDTPVLIYLLEQDKRFYVAAKKLFLDIEQGRKRGIIAGVGLTECLTGPLRQKRKDIADHYIALLPNMRNMTIDRYQTNEHLYGAAALRAYYNLRTPDALHLMSSILGGAEMFITNDRRLKAVKEIKVQLLSEM